MDCPGAVVVVEIPYEPFVVVLTEHWVVDVGGVGEVEMHAP